ncbi:UNVERIFIED_CONTAM: hypothetical protein NCL1_40935 [Trichonephila clavipes]
MTRRSMLDAVCLVFAIRSLSNMPDMQDNTTAVGGKRGKVSPFYEELEENFQSLGEPTPLATNRKKRQARTRWRQAKPTIAAREYSGIRSPVPASSEVNQECHKFSSKQLERLSKRAEKDEKVQRNKIKKVSYQKFHLMNEQTYKYIIFVKISVSLEGFLKFILEYMKKGQIQIYIYVRIIKLRGVSVK